MQSALLIIGFGSVFASLASVSRLTWAFARDGGLPFSRFFAYVNPHYRIPIRAISLVGSVGGRPASSREPVGWNESVQRRGLRRMPSDSVESVEEGEGEGVRMQSIPPAQSAATRVRVSRGSRSGASVSAGGRKFD